MSTPLCTRRAALLSPVALAAIAQTALADTDIRLATAEATADAAPSTGAIAAALHDAQKQTPVFTGDADIDAVRALIPLQESALAIATVLRTYGEDPDTRQLAQIILAQRQTELDWMKDWLSQHSAP